MALLGNFASLFGTMHEKAAAPHNIWILSPQ